LWLFLGIALALALAAVAAHAQQPQRFNTPSGNYVGGAVAMCLDPTTNTATPALNGTCATQSVPLVVQQIKRSA
jgi:hypothetical protein